MDIYPWIKKRISSINLDKISHALIIEGQEGIGKNQLCFYLINELLIGSNSKNLIKNNSHPDLFLVNKSSLTSFYEKKNKSFSKNIPIELIREAINFISLKSALSKNKVLFIDNAENLSISSQNALLKTLEEPPDDTFIIIQSNRFKCLNQTIYSRCELIHFNNLSQNEILNWAENILDDRNDKHLIPNFMTPKKVSQLIQDGSFENLRQLNKSLESLFSEGVDGNKINNIIDLNMDFSEKLNYIIDYALSLLKKGSSSIHPVHLSDYIEQLSDFRQNLFEINTLNQKYSLNHLLLKIPINS